MFDQRVKQQGFSDDEQQRAQNTGVLMSSGFIAGESLMAVLIALLVIGGDFAPWLLGFQALVAHIRPSFWPSLIILPVVIYLLTGFSIKTARQQ